jgi:tetratricopeptide (TPR) repeat protein
VRCLVGTWPALLVAALLFASVRPAAAQDLALKRSAVRPRPNACPAIAPPRQPAPDQRDEARQRATLGQEAAIVGNQRAAREQLQRAAQLDPTNEDIAYQYGRTLEDSGTPVEALREYCRYLALAPAGGDAADVRARVAALAPPAPSASVPDRATPEFAAGLTSYDQRRYADAERAFGRAITEAPTWPEAHYNRAMAHLAQREPAKASVDLRRYLELRPDAPDRVSVLNRLDLIERPVPYTPGGALARGIIPGFGQFYTRRPLLGTAVLAVAGSGAAYALQSVRRTELQERPGFFIDITGKRQDYIDTVQVTVTEYPHRTVGLAIAGGLTVAAAIEAFSYARRVRTNAAMGGVPRTSLRMVPLPGTSVAATGVALELRIPLPRRGRR